MLLICSIVPSIVGSVVFLRSPATMAGMRAVVPGVPLFLGQLFSSGRYDPQAVQHCLLPLAVCRGHHRQ